MSTPTATPRTDAALLRYDHDDVKARWGDSHIVFASFARTLETELTAAKAECERLTEQVQMAAALNKESESELARLSAEVERLTKAAVPLCVGAPIIGILAREGQYLSGDGQGLIAASDLFGNDPFARAERAEAAIAKERARLDWQNENGFLTDIMTHGAGRPHPDDYWLCTDGDRSGRGSTIRDAIDAAIAASTPNSSVSH